MRNRSNDAFQGALRLVFREETGVQVLSVEIPAIEAFHRAATQGLPAHRVETRRPSGRIAPAALEIMRDLGMALCPQWRERLIAVTGKRERKQANVGHS